MLDPGLLQSDPEQTWQRLARRNTEVDQQAFAELSGRLKELRASDQALRERRNQISGQIGQAGGGDPELRRQASEVSNELKALAERLAEAEAQWRAFALDLPNLPDEDVPEGNDESANKVLKVYDGAGNEQAADWRPQDENPLAHEEIGQKLEQYRPELAAAMSGARFSVLVGPMARMHRALGQFLLDLQIDKGYRECWVPWLLHPPALEGAGQLPKFADDLFRAGEDYYLLPTAEVPLVNLYADRIVPEEELPARVTALTPCFRSEAGSYGRDTKGLIRQHQFEKVELVCLTRADESEAMLQTMVEDARAGLVQLGLPHRIVALCTGDLSFTAAKTLDIEVWMPGQGQWREISSCSNCRDFQARRLKIRRRAESGGKKTELLHTLNGSALAVGRTLAAVLETYWDGDGVAIPEVLQSRMGGLQRL